MFAKPQEEHRWLEQLVGSWNVEQDCVMPDGTTKSTSEMSCRMVGGLWLVSENAGESPEGDWTCIMTLGFDPSKKAYVGTFLGSMMTHLWQYQGVVDESGSRLPLMSRGPTFDGSGVTNYRDTVEIISPDKWLFIGEMEQNDGQWKQIMLSTHARK